MTKQKNQNEPTQEDDFDKDLHQQKPDQSALTENYSELELKPGGTGKQGDQQEFGQDREQRKDKSRSSGDSDKMHEE